MLVRVQWWNLYRGRWGRYITVPVQWWKKWHICHFCTRTMLKSLKSVPVQWWFSLGSDALIKHVLQTEAWAVQRVAKRITWNEAKRQYHALVLINWWTAESSSLAWLIKSTWTLLREPVFMTPHVLSNHKLARAKRMFTENVDWRSLFTIRRNHSLWTLNE